MKPKTIVLMIQPAIVIASMACWTSAPIPQAVPPLRPTATPTPVHGVPLTSTSAITLPPANMVGINTHTEIYGTGADPNIITLGPKVSKDLRGEPYPNKTSMEFELNHKAPVLAPIDMVLVGFDNRNAKYRVGAYRQKQLPYNDLELCFESASPDWPGMVICSYHLLSSPLLLGHNKNPDCSGVEEWQGTYQSQGRIFYYDKDITTSPSGNALACGTLIGHSVKRGELIGFAGSAGTHSMASFRFKVSHTSENPTVNEGNHYLHWVQPGEFFYWKCYSPDANFSGGILAYPFQCGGYQLPVEQHDVTFKYLPAIRESGKKQ